MAWAVCERSGLGEPGSRRQERSAVFRGWPEPGRSGRWRRQHADAGMAMVIVVPGEESLAEGVAVLQAAEALGELRAIFHGAKLAF